MVCGAASRFPTQADPFFLLLFIRVRALCSCRSHACREAASLDRALQPVWRLPPEYCVLRLLPCLRLPRPSPKPGLPCSLFLYGLALPANLQFCVFSRQGTLTSASLFRALGTRGFPSCRRPRSRSEPIDLCSPSRLGSGVSVRGFPPKRILRARSRLSKYTRTEENFTRGDRHISWSHMFHLCISASALFSTAAFAVN